MKHARADYDRIQDPEGKIPADEPVFLIRGQDRFAGAALRYYADLAEMGGAGEDLVKATLRQSHLMDAWPKRKTPDL